MRLYDGTVMETSGTCKLQCEIKNRKCDIDFIMVKHDTSPILGVETCLKEGIMVIPNDISLIKSRDMS